MNVPGPGKCRQEECETAEDQCKRERTIEWVPKVRYVLDEPVNQHCDQVSCECQPDQALCSQEVGW